jgi:hypothetical protein
MTANGDVIELELTKTTLPKTKNKPLAVIVEKRTAEND